MSNYQYIYTSQLSFSLTIVSAVRTINRSTVKCDNVSCDMCGSWSAIFAFCEADTGRIGGHITLRDPRNDLWWLRTVPQASSSPSSQLSPFFFCPLSLQLLQLSHPGAVFCFNFWPLLTSLLTLTYLTHLAWQRDESWQQIGMVMQQGMKKGKFQVCLHFHILNLQILRYIKHHFCFSHFYFCAVCISPVLKCEGTTGGLASFQRRVSPQAWVFEGEKGRKARAWYSTVQQKKISFFRIYSTPILEKWA